MSAKSEVCIKDLPFKKPRKFPLGCDVDKEEIFDFPYLADETTISFLKNYGRIMFIIRGPNSTLKSYLSEMIMKHYPSSKLCCADHYFSQTFSPPTRTKETIKLSHDYCHKK